MKVLEPYPDRRDDRPASKLLHHESNLRVVAFSLAPWQRIAPHRSGSTVMVQVSSGAGTFLGADEDALLGPGEGAVYEPGELHAIEAAGAPLEFVAVIAPGPK